MVLCCHPLHDQSATRREARAESDSVDLAVFVLVSPFEPALRADLGGLPEG